eukprot:TRINITY_DN4375_c0_g1_i1.p1 TRINITY_DN4375_c0_g1~~TRINITY_DN4375_c0_g1_i1.p1  ORF type:complete len:580 (-),score=88.08 TRINITY_DN4375_c0_g1_i1:70-1764(-)
MCRWQSRNGSDTRCCIPWPWLRQHPATSPAEVKEELIAVAARASAVLRRERLDVGIMAPDVSEFSILDPIPERLRSQVLRLADLDPGASSAVGAMVGMAVADSVGAFLEFLPVGKQGSHFDPLTLKIEGGFNKFKLKPGQWTDDTSMGLCLADSLLVCEGYDGTDIRVRFWNWWHRGYNNAFRRDKSRKGSVGLGGNVAVSLKDVCDSSPSPRFESTSQDAGNGSIMRLVPVPIFFCRDPRQAAHASQESSRTTHPGEIAAAACHFLGFLLAKAIDGSPERAGTAADFLESIVEEYLGNPWPAPLQPKLLRLLRSEEPVGSRERCWNWRDPHGPYLKETLQARGCRYNGYPVSPGYLGSYSLDGLAIALHSVYHTSSFMEALARCVNFLGDADSTGAICGQIAGAFYGSSAIDSRLVDRLRRWDCDEVALRAALLYAAGSSRRLDPFIDVSQTGEHSVENTGDCSNRNATLLTVPGGKMLAGKKQMCEARAEDASTGADESTSESTQVCCVTREPDSGAVPTPHSSRICRLPSLDSPASRPAQEHSSFGKLFFCTQTQGSATCR